MHLRKDLSDLEACCRSAQPGTRGILLLVIIGGNEAIKSYDSGPKKRHRSFHPHPQEPVYRRVALPGRSERRRQLTLDNFRSRVINAEGTRREAPANRTAAFPRNIFQEPSDP